LKVGVLVVAKRFEVTSKVLELIAKLTPSGYRSPSYWQLKIYF
jgi:hypothetical protein